MALGKLPNSKGSSHRRSGSCQKPMEGSMAFRKLINAKGRSHQRSVSYQMAMSASVALGKLPIADGGSHWQSASCQISTGASVTLGELPLAFRQLPIANVSFQTAMGASVANWKLPSRRSGNRYEGGNHGPKIERISSRPDHRSGIKAPPARGESGNEVARCPRPRSSIRKDSKTPLSCEILFQVSLRIAKRNLVVLQKRVDLEPRLQSQQAPDLRFAQGICAVALDGKGLQGMARHISPLTAERFGDVFRQADRNFHGMRSRSPRS
jgi:hypothetical protein